MTDPPPSVASSRWGRRLAPPAFVAASSAARLEGAQGLLDLPDLQCAWLLLLYCAAPRAQHLLRTLPPDLSAGYANAHDQAIWDTLQVLLGGSPTPDSAAWAAARRLTFLPQSDGGLEVPSAVLTAPAAFWADSLPIIHARWPGVAERCVGELVSGSRAPSLRAGAGELLDRAGFSPGMARVHAPRRAAT